MTRRLLVQNLACKTYISSKDMRGRKKIQSGSQSLGELPEQHDAVNPQLSGCKRSAVHLETP